MGLALHNCHEKSVSKCLNDFIMYTKKLAVLAEITLVFYQI